ncbi:MAG TPA: ABC transporter substrate-binding protein, partial [Verrucomicrobiae bacterium]|nr:ABC transporter substrate-binding protein [Verrucomicrobiae bacterium]
KKEASKLGLKFGGSTTVSASSPTDTAQCLTLMQGGTDDMAMFISSTEHARFIRNCKQQGYTGMFGSGADGFSQKLDGSVPDTTIAGAIGVFPYWANTPSVKQFRSVMAKYQPQATYKNGESPGIWAALQLFRKAMGTPSGTVTPASVTTAYGKIKNVTLGGLFPQPITFTAGKAAPVIKCAWLFKWTAGSKYPMTLRYGKSGNGATGSLASSCPPPPST